MMSDGDQALLLAMECQRLREANESLRERYADLIELLRAVRNERDGVAHMSDEGERKLRALLTTNEGTDAKG